MSRQRGIFCVMISGNLNILIMKKRTKYIIGLGIFLLAVLITALFRSSGAKPALQTDTVQKHDLKRTVLATGTVTSGLDVGLGFRSSGAVSRILSPVGTKVISGSVLATLEQRSELAAVTQARGSLAQAQANYQKVLAGSSSEEVVLAGRGVDAATTTLDNAKKSLQDTKQQQAVLVNNALSALLNSTLSATPAAGNIGSTSVTVLGTYTSTEQGFYVVQIYNTNNGPRFVVHGLENGDGAVKANIATSFGNKGLLIQFSSTNVYDADSWTIEIPNMKAANYVTNKNAYAAAVEAQTVAVSTAENTVASAASALNQAVATLDAKRAAARPADVSAANAQILSAQGQLEAANAQLENTIIRAPSNGTVTAVDLKVGEQATALKPVITLQDINNLYVEANVSEANVAQVKLDQPVKFTFDALGADREFTGKLLTIDPASTVVSGVVNYKITASVNQVTDIKPGMTANMSVLVGIANNVLAVPGRSIVEHDGKKFVRVITDEKKQTYKETELTTGLEADGGLVEIKTGLEAGQTVVTFVEPKK